MSYLTRGGKYGAPQYNQAFKIAQRFGGERQLAKVIGVNRVTVYRWSYPPPIGSDGVIPTRAAQAIREAARKHGVILTAEDWHLSRWTDVRKMKRVRRLPMELAPEPGPIQPTELEKLLT